ncbi:MAG TPA: calcium-binding protein [Chloroflexota bacterium]
MSMAQRPDEEDDFDQRLSLEIIPDAYGPKEQAFSWYCYLEEHLQFPFQAECVTERSTSPLIASEKVDVVGMPTEEVCERDMFVNIRWQQRVLAVSLSQLTGVEVDEETKQAIRDWHTWIDRGYEL